jgi:tRNA pseudouridine55 synthase
MSSPTKKRFSLNGLLVLNKPSGTICRKLLNDLNRKFQPQKIGHVGTLDPIAQGVFLVLFGEGTKFSPFLLEGKKSYSAVIRLGISTTTYDREGEVVRSSDPSRISLEEIRSALQKFRGEILQVPPPYSALKWKGKPLYQYARKGTPILPPPRKVTIYSLRLENYSPPDLTVEVICSRGTYLRSLAHDLGESLGVGAHLYEITRTGSEPYTLSDALSYEECIKMSREELETKLIPPDRILSHLPTLYLEGEIARKVAYGKPIPAEFLEKWSHSHLKKGDLFQIRTPDLLAIVTLTKSPEEWGKGGGSPLRYERIIVLPKP